MLLLANTAMTIQTFAKQVFEGNSFSLPLAKSCAGIEGNFDFYGLGIRIGIYLQWFSSWISNTFNPTAAAANHDANTIFLLAVLIATAIAFGQGSLQPAEKYILLLFVYWLLLHCADPFWFASTFLEAVRSNSTTSPTWRDKSGGPSCERSASWQPKATARSVHAKGKASSRTMDSPQHKAPCVVMGWRREQKLHRNIPSSAELVRLVGLPWSTTLEWLSTMYSIHLFLRTTQSIWHPVEVLQGCTNNRPCASRYHNYDILLVDDTALVAHQKLGPQALYHHPGREMLARSLGSTR